MTLFIILAVAVFPGCGSRTRPAVPPQATVDRILSSLESTFTAMKEHDYRRVWAGLTAASRNRIVGDAHKALAKAGREDASPAMIERDFWEGGPLSRSYWDGFLRRFDPDAALKESRWEMGKVEGDEAYVLITHKEAERPAVVKLLREDEGWKVGLVESFWDQPGG